MNKIDEEWFDYKNKLYEALDNEFIRTALRRAIKSFRANRDKAIKRYDETARRLGYKQDEDGNWYKWL